MKKLFPLLALAAVSTALITVVDAQVIHKATIVWQESSNADVYRSASSCDAAASFTKIAANVASGYVDLAVTGGATYCYYIIEQPTNFPSNLLEVPIPLDTVVTIKAAKQTAGAEAQ